MTDERERQVVVTVGLGGKQAMSGLSCAVEDGQLWWKEVSSLGVAELEV